MATKYIHTSIDGRALKLSNLGKILYPQMKVSKAEVVKYYLDVAPLLLKYIKDRPLTVIRYPDGIDGKSFYSKDKPKWTPDWVDGMLIQHEEKKIDYLVPTDKASIVWLANLACLELHPTQFIKSNKMRPDFFVIDLDPDENLDFQAVKEAASLLHLFLKRYDYTPFLKTSGGKGLHLYIPVKPEVSFDILTASVKSLTKIFISQHKGLYTLNVSKAQRKGKILIDIYRNHLSNTTVAPYSLRGRAGAPISMPIEWSLLEGLAKSSQYHINNYQKHFAQYGDPWDDWRKYEVSLHDQKDQHTVSVEMDERLISYNKKRDFKKTAEPAANLSLQSKDLYTERSRSKYVIQLHNASNLHYDLRLEDKGVLLSWAIPKGLPFSKGQKRLAIRTEDHPIKYIDFEGVIPKGQYGAGEMWVFDYGKIIWSKRSEGSYHFVLDNGHDKRTYKLFKTTRSNQWLIESPQDYIHNNLKRKIDPMLASASRKIPLSSNYKYEVKWDGIRVIIYYEKDTVTIISRGGRDITAQFPELQIPDLCNAEQAVLDAEIVVLDQRGRPMFHDVISRMHKKGARSIEQYSVSKPVTCYLFDLMALDGYDIKQKPLKRRRIWLKTILRTGTFYRMSDSFDDGQQLFDAIERQGMEGIMAKDQKGVYLVGQRSNSWIKIKCRKLEQCIIIGYTKGKGDRSGLMGAMHLATMKEDKLKYMGKVGTGFDHKMLKQLSKTLFEIKETSKPITDQIEEEIRTVWIEPKLRCEIEYATLSSNGTYREPVYMKLIN